jgi:hypothetical protein
MPKKAKTIILDDDYDEKYSDVNNKDDPCILNKQFPKESNNEITIKKTQKFYVFSLKKDVDEIKLVYKIDQHTSQYGYIVVEIFMSFVTIQPRMIQGKQINKCTNIKSRKRGYSLPLRRTYKTRSRPRSKRRSLRKI